MLYKTKIYDRVFDISLYILMIIAGIVTLYPFLNVLAISLNDSSDAVKGGIYLWPRKFTLRNYVEIFQNPNLETALFTSCLRTLVGTVLSVFSVSMLAYVLSRRDFSARKIMTVLFVLTMYVDGGMVPTYLLIRQLKLINNFWVYILPGLVGAFYIIIIRSFIDSLGNSLQESAQIDGANDLIIFFRIIFPLCMPVIATVALYNAVWQWNSWFDTYIYASRNKSLITLQYELMKVLQSTTASSSSNVTAVTSESAPKVSPESIRMTITIVATVPILVVYPFLQRYFVKGMMVGAIKS